MVTGRKRPQRPTKLPHDSRKSIKPESNLYDWLQAPTTRINVPNPGR
jgi:hypothetical protein